MFIKLKKSILIQFALVTILALVVFYPSFNLALFGDDWLAFFRYIQHLSPKSSDGWNHLTYYLTPYGAQDIIMGLLYKVYGLNSNLYYLTSFILRLLAAFSLFPLVFYLTKNKLSAFFAVLFFSVTVVGLDTTNWVFNMPTYITISLFFLSLYLFISAREGTSNSRLFLSAILYYFSYITTPIRMHGSLVFLFLLEVFWVIQNKDFRTLKKAIIRFGIMFLVFLIIKFTGHSLGPATEISERFNLGITSGLAFLEQGRFDFIFYPVVMVGSMIFPDLLLGTSSVITFKQLLITVIPTFLISILLIYLLVKFTANPKSKTFINLSLSMIFWTFVVAVINRGNLNSFNNSQLINLSLIGGYIMLFTIAIIFVYYKQKNIVNLLFLSLSWMIFSFFFAWWWVPASIFPTTYRYLIVSAAGLTILLSTFISLSKNKSFQLIILVLLSPFLFINILATNLYLNQALASHNQEISDKIWASIPNISEITKSNKPFIFYFEGDGTNSGILHDVITFGFPPHMALIYNLREGDPIPVPMSDFKEVISAVMDGKTMPAYGYPVKPVPVERIYAFHLQGKDNLIDITNEARDKLKQQIR